MVDGDVHGRRCCGAAADGGGDEAGEMASSIASAESLATFLLPGVRT